MGELTREEAGDVLFSCRQIRRKCERQMQNKKNAETITKVNERRFASLNAAIKKLKREYSAYGELDDPRQAKKTLAEDIAALAAEEKALGSGSD